MISPGGQGETGRAGAQQVVVHCMNTERARMFLLNFVKKMVKASIHQELILKFYWIHWNIRVETK